MGQAGGRLGQARESGVREAVTIRFFIPGEPPRTTAQQKGRNSQTGHYYKPQKLLDAEKRYLTYARMTRPSAPLVGPVELRVEFRFARGRHRDGEPKTTRPDTDNMIKLLKDCLTRAGYWGDDAQVALETTAKLWSSDPGVLVEVHPWRGWGREEE